MYASIMHCTALHDKALSYIDGNFLVLSILEVYADDIWRCLKMKELTVTGKNACCHQLFLFSYCFLKPSLTQIPIFVNVPYSKKLQRTAEMWLDLDLLRNFKIQFA